MKGTGAGWDSWFYRFFIVGGFLTVIGSTVYTALTQPDGSQVPLYVGIGGVAVFMVLIVSYWVVQIMFKGYGGMGTPDLTRKIDVNDLSVLQSWNTLFAAMVTEGGDPEKMKEVAKKSNSNFIIWFAWAAVIALCPIGLMVPYAFGLLEWAYIRYGVMLYVGTIFLMLFVTNFLGRKAETAGEEMYLEPLGLKLSQTPEMVLVDPNLHARQSTVLQGNRFDRGITITLDLDEVTTQVQARGMEISIRERGGKLEAEGGAPPSVLDFVHRLRKAKRWEGLQLHADGKSITASRKLKGQNMWLYDLWLIERLIGGSERPRKT